MEINTNFESDGNFKLPKVSVNLKINPDMYRVAKQKNLNMSACLDFGIRFILAEQDEIDYPNNKLLLKIQKLQEVIIEKNKIIEKFETNETK